MIFPKEPLPVSVDIAPGASPSLGIDTWDPYWIDITNDVRVSQGIVIDEGIPDEANQADPGTCVLTVDNGTSRVASTAGRIGCYSARNPLGPYYGLLSKNTPLRVRMLRGKDSFARSVSGGWGTSETGIGWTTSGGTLSTDGTRGVMTGAFCGAHATNTGAWDFNMTGGVAVNILPGAGGDSVHLVNFRRSSDTDQYRFWIDIQPGGGMTLYFQRYLAGVLTNIGGIVAPGIGAVAANTRYNYRLKAEGGFLGAKVWLASGSEPVAWGMSVDEGAYNLDNTALGTDIQVQWLKVSAPATTIGYFYSIRIDSYPFIGTITELPVRWDKSGKDSTAPLKASGVLRQLQQGKTPLKSPLLSYLDQFTPAGLWMLEDDSGSTIAASGTSGVRGATVYSASPAGWDTPALGGSSSQYGIAVDTTISGTLPKVTPSGGWSFLFAFYMPVLPVTNPVILRVRASGTVTQWDVLCSDNFGGVVYLLGYLADGTVVVNVSTPLAAGQWTIGQVEIEQVGANFTGRIVHYDVSTGSLGGGTSGSVAGSIGSPNGWAIYGSTGFQSAGAGPLVFYPTMAPVSGLDLIDAARGFAGETALERIVRLSGERGVHLDTITGGTSSAMGVQSSDTFLNIIGEAADTDMGLLTEFRGGLRYRTRGRRYGQNFRMTPDFALGQVAEPPEPIDDDQRLRNDVTVTRKDGASARAYDPESIAVNGLYDTSVEINPYSDDDLESQATFRLHVGTWDELRWPSITLDLARNASTAGFIERAMALDAGAYIGVFNPPTNLPLDTVRLLVEHVRQMIGPYEWTMELTCSPYGPWRIPNSAYTTARIDLVGSTLGSTEGVSSVGASDSWTIVNTDNPWDATDLPYTWDVNGELVSVTALSGSPLLQTATVLRGANGITKAHSIGEEIHISPIMYVAL